LSSWEHSMSRWWWSTCPRTPRSSDTTSCTPGQIWRLAWPIHFAAVLTLGWLLWTGIGYATGWMQRFLPARPVAGAMPVLLVLAMTTAALPHPRLGMESRSGQDRGAPGFARRQALLLRLHAGGTDGDPAPQQGGLRYVPKKSSLVDSLKEQPGFTPVDTPSERYFLFVVDSEKLPGWKILTGTKPGGDHSVKCSSLDLPFRRELC